MKVFVGLGNSQENYQNTRHNAGYMVVEKIKSQDLKNKDLVVVKTNSFMNQSGDFVKDVFENYHLSPNNLYIIHDDLDIKLGEYKIQKGKGPKDHKGLESIYTALGTNDFWHVRVGIENRDGENRIPGETYVLQDFTDGEVETISQVASEIAYKIKANEII